MNELYRVEGTLSRGFVGQITYTVCLEEPLQKLDIHFTFDQDKRKYRPEEVTDELIRDTKALCLKNYDLTVDDDRARDIILGDMKTEIHTLATVNDEFLGCVHKQLTDRHMLWVTVLVFNVIKDGTGYVLTVSGE